MRKLFLGSAVVFVVALYCILSSNRAHAASAVANDFDSDSIGWGAKPTKSKAARKAERKCIQLGAPSDVKAWSKADGPGWASVHSTVSRDYVTHSFRYNTKKKAKRAGKRFCENTGGGESCVLVKVFYDQYAPEKDAPLTPGHHHAVRDVRQK